MDDFYVRQPGSASLHAANSQGAAGFCNSSGTPLLFPFHQLSLLVTVFYNRLTERV